MDQNGSHHNEHMGQVPPNQQYGQYGPAPQPNQQQQNDDTKTLGILSIVFAFFFSLAGLIIAVVGKNKAKTIEKTTGQKAEGATLLTVGLVLSIIMTVLPVIAFILSMIFFVGIFSAIGSSISDMPSSGGNTVTESDYSYIIKGNWDCVDATSSITGYIYDDEGHIIGHDGTKQNPEFVTRYQFDSSNSIYAYAMNSKEDNYLRGSYTSSLYEKEDDGRYEYELTVTFSEYSSDGELDESVVGEETTWNVIVDPYDTDVMGLGLLGGTGMIYECDRVK